jgi:hypothetical protein
MPTIRAYAIATVVVLSLLYVPISRAEIVGESGNDLIVEAEGHGATKLEALKAAWMEAVRLGIGMYLAAKSTVIDDALQEEIVMHSRGKVDSYEELSASKGDSGWIVKIRAKIEKDILQETAVVSQNKSKTVSVDATNIAAKKITAEAKKLSAEELAKTYNPQFKIEDFFDYDFSTKQENGKLIIIHHVKLNLDTFKKFTDELESVLDKVAIKKSIEAFDRDNMEDAAKLKKSGEIIGYPYYAYCSSDSEIAIAKNISEYILYKLDKNVHKIIVAKIELYFKNYSLRFILQAIDDDDDILLATQHGINANLSYGTVYRPISPSIELPGPPARFFINTTFDKEWKDISSDDLARIKSIKSRMQIKK